jgi:hypothetical protein
MRALLKEEEEGEIPIVNDFRARFYSGLNIYFATFALSLFGFEFSLKSKECLNETNPSVLTTFGLFNNSQNVSKGNVWTVF